MLNRLSSQTKVKVLTVLAIVGLITTAFFVMRRDVHHENPPDKERRKLVAEKAAVLGQALRKYVLQHERLPSATDWEQALTPFLPKGFTFDIPSPDNRSRRRFAMNSKMSNLPDEEVPSPYWEQIVFFESTNTHPSASDPLHSLPMDDSEGFVVVYADGRFEYIPPDRKDQFIARHGSIVEETR
jgi:hypothetical protein